jgi:hypothetical protein
MRPIRLANGAWINPLHVRSFDVLAPRSRLYWSKGSPITTADRWCVRIMFDDPDAERRLQQAELIGFDDQEAAEAYCRALAESFEGAATT